MAQGAPRWDDDVVGRGVGTASWLLPSLAELQRLAEQPGWVAEAPEAHLAPHLRGAADAAGLTWLAEHVEPDGTYVVTLGLSEDANKRAIRQKVWQIIGSIAESSSHVVERSSPDGTVFEVVTGQPDGAFAAHGHTLRILISSAG